MVTAMEAKSVGGANRNQFDQNTAKFMYMEIVRAITRC